MFRTFSRCCIVPSYQAEQYPAPGMYNDDLIMILACAGRLSRAWGPPAEAHFRSVGGRSRIDRLFALAVIGPGRRAGAGQDNRPETPTAVVSSRRAARSRSSFSTRQRRSTSQNFLKLARGDSTTASASIRRARFVVQGSVTRNGPADDIRRMGKAGRPHDQGRVQQSEFGAESSGWPERTTDSAGSQFYIMLGREPPERPVHAFGA